MAPPIDKKHIVQLPRDAIKRVVLGQSFAEYDKLLDKEETFVLTPALRSAIDKSKTKCIYVGRRGTGKTAITRYLALKLANVVNLHPQSYVPFEKPLPIDKLLNTHQQYFKTIVSCYRRAISLEAVRDWLQRHIVKAHRLPDELNRERQHIDDYDFDENTISFLSDALDAIEKGNQKNWLKIINRAKDTSKAVDDLAHENGVHCHPLIDRLDEAWDGSDWAVVFLMGLMHACVEITASSKSIHPLLFVRENIFDRVRVVDNEFARLETSVVSLEWTQAYLLELIERRLSFPFTTKLKLGGDTWDNFFDKVDGNSSWKYILDHCQQRPK
jgi:hypothetical protein